MIITAYQKKNCHHQIDEDESLFRKTSEPGDHALKIGGKQTEVSRFIQQVCIKTFASFLAALPQQ